MRKLILFLTILLIPIICLAEISEFESFAYAERYDSDGYVITKYDSPQTWIAMRRSEDREVRVWRKVGGICLLALGCWGYSRNNDYGAVSGTVFMFSGFIRIFE